MKSFVTVLSICFAISTILFFVLDLWTVKEALDDVELISMDEILQIIEEDQDPNNEEHEIATETIANHSDCTSLLFDTIENNATVNNMPDNRQDLINLQQQGFSVIAELKNLPIHDWQFIESTNKGKSDITREKSYIENDIDKNDVKRIDFSKKVLINKPMRTAAGPTSLSDGKFSNTTDLKLLKEVLEENDLNIENVEILLLLSPKLQDEILSRILTAAKKKGYKGAVLGVTGGLVSFAILDYYDDDELSFWEKFLIASGVGILIFIIYHGIYLLVGNNSQ